MGTSQDLPVWRKQVGIITAHVAARSQPLYPPELRGAHVDFSRAACLRIHVGTESVETIRSPWNECATWDRWAVLSAALQDPARSAVLSAWYLLISPSISVAFSLLQSATRRGFRWYPPRVLASRTLKTIDSPLPV